jgi:predicted RNA-binding Zn ribbon-like protein
VTEDGWIGLEPAGSGVPGALARIMLIAADAAAAGTWPRLKACAADDCQWAFYDRSPTRTGCWCSMRVCGARAKSRAYRQRASGAARPAPGQPGSGRDRRG